MTGHYVYLLFMLCCGRVKRDAPQLRPQGLGELQRLGNHGLEDVVLPLFIVRRENRANMRRERLAGLCQGRRQNTGNRPVRVLHPLQQPGRNWLHLRPTQCRYSLRSRRV